MADRREWILSLLGRETISPAARTAGRSLDDLGDSARHAKEDAKRLDSQINDTHKRIHELSQEIRKTGDLTLFKELGKQQRDLKKLTGLKEMFSKLGDDGAEGFAARFSARIGPLLARAPVHPALLGLVAAAMPAVGAAVSAGVLLGLGGGVVAAGVKLAFNDPRVKAEAESLGKFVGTTLSSASRSFVPATIGAMGQIREEVRDLGSDLEKTFRAGAAYVAPLTRTLTNLADGIVPRLPKALERAAPVFRALEDSAVVLGQAVGAALDSISRGAGGAGLMVRDLAVNVAISVRAIGEMIGFLSKAYAMIRVGTSTNKTQIIAQMASDQAAAAAYKTELDKLIGGLQGTGDAADGAAKDMRSLEQIMEDSANTATDAFNAQTRFGEALSETTKKAAHAGAGLDVNTKRGRENRDMLERLATQTRESTKALEGMAGGQGKANKIMNDGYSRFMAVAQAMGVDKRQADALARSLGLIPRSTKHHHSSNTAAERAAAERLKKKLLEIERTYYAQVNVRYVEAGAKSGSLGAVGQRARGGPVMKNRAYVVGEHEAEVFVPKEDGQIVPSIDRYLAGGGSSGGMRGGSTDVRIRLDFAGAEDAFKTLFRKWVRVDGGGSVQTAFGR